jgi:N-acetylneuraminate lyase
MPAKITGGVWPAVLTPYTDDAKVNLKALDQLIDLFIEQKLGGLYMLGSTGQGPSLSTADRKLVAEHTVRRAAGRLPVMVHVGAISTREAVELARHAQGCGADAVSSVPPMYFPVDVEQTFEHYRRIASATNLPFFPYHARFASMALPPAKQYVEQILQLPNIAGLKLTENDFFLFNQISLHSGGKLVLFSGYDELIFAGAVAGAHGAIGSFYNMFGPAFVKARAAFVKGDFEVSRRLTDAFTSLLERLITPRKAIYAFLRQSMKIKYGIDIGPGQSPFYQVEHRLSDDEVKAAIRSVDEAAGV